MRRIVPWLLLASVGAISACGAGPTPPATIVENYVGAVAEGDFATACAGLDQHARQSLGRTMSSHRPCRVLLPKCFPNRAVLLGHDQTQLFYTNVQVAVRGSRAVALTGGTAVGRAVRQVSLVQKDGQWVLNSYGKERCPHSAKRR